MDWPYPSLGLYSLLVTLELGLVGGAERSRGAVLEATTLTLGVGPE